MPSILIVDDEPTICWGFREFLTEDGHDVRVAASAEEALEAVQESLPDAVVLDVRLPGMDGLTAIPHLREHIGDAPVIVITAFGDLDTAVRAVQQGAFDYLPKPFDLDQAAEVIARALDVSRLGHNSAEQGKPPSTESAEELVGASPRMQQVFKQIALVAGADVAVLITGESGTGKELVARAIHRHSPRRDGPFLPVHLAALSESLVESELFGHVKGAFTGATDDRQGLLELANSGTVLLDEIGDASPALQVKLLRVLEQREVTPVGSAQARSVNGRIIAATNRSLPDLIREGQFRDDLFFRLSVFRIELPPLRARKEDIPALAEHFLRAMQSRTSNQDVMTISDEAMEELHRREWRGNVRELRNAIEHAAIVSRGVIQPKHLPEPLALNAAAESSGGELSSKVSGWTSQALDTDTQALYEDFIAATEPELLRTVLAHCNGNKAAAAERLGIHRTTLRQKLRKHGIGD